MTENHWHWKLIKCLRFLRMKYTQMCIQALSTMVMYHYIFSMEVSFGSFSSLGMGLSLISDSYLRMTPSCASEEKMAENRRNTLLKTGMLLKIGHYSLGKKKKKNIFISNAYFLKDNSMSLTFTSSSNPKLRKWQVCGVESLCT